MLRVEGDGYPIGGTSSPIPILVESTLDKIRLTPGQTWNVVMYCTRLTGDGKEESLRIIVMDRSGTYSVDCPAGRLCRCYAPMPSSVWFSGSPYQCCPPDTTASP